MPSAQDGLNIRSLDYLPPQSLDQDERERRLQEAKQQGRGRALGHPRRVSPSLDDDAAQGDIGNRSPLSGLQKPFTPLPVRPAKPRAPQQVDSIVPTPHRRSLNPVGRPLSTMGVEDGHDKIELPSHGEVAGKSASQPFDIQDHATQRQTLTNDLGISTKPSTRPLSGLELLAAKSRQNSDNPLVSLPGDSSGESRHPEARDEEQPVQRQISSFTRGLNRGLTLPKNFDQLSEEEKNITVQHEIAKERKRDLDTLGSVLWAYAELLCYSDRELPDRMIETESKEVYEIGQFIKLVIDLGRPGKAMRTRIQDILGNVKRRIGKGALNSPEPSNTAVLQELSRTFGKERIEFVDKETPKVQKEIDHWGDLRKSNHAQRNSARRRPQRSISVSAGKRKQVRFAHTTKDTPTRQVLPGKAPRGSVNATENRRQAQYARQEKLEQKLREQLKLFDNAKQDEIAEIQSRVTELEDELDEAQLAESESEEEDGAEYVFGAGYTSEGNQSDVSQRAKPSIEQDIDEINRLEDSRQKASGIHPTQRRFDPESQEKLGATTTDSKPCQSFDAELLRQMQIRKRQALEAPDSTTVTATLANPSDDGSDEALEDLSSDDEDEENRQIFKYEVRGEFRGIVGWEDGVQYLFRRSYNLDRANKKMKEIRKCLPQLTFQANDVDTSREMSTVSKADGLKDRHLTLGYHGEVGARLWVEKKLVNLNKKEFKDAEKCGAVKKASMWAVF